jgi:hypothetical protein
MTGRILAAVVLIFAAFLVAGCGGGGEAKTACERSNYGPSKGCRKETLRLEKENEAALNGGAAAPSEPSQQEYEEVEEGYESAAAEEQREREENPSGESKWEELAH